MRFLLLLTLLALPSQAIEVQPTQAYACPDGYDYCVVRKDVFRDMARQYAPRPCHQRDV